MSGEINVANPDQPTTILGLRRTPAEVRPRQRDVIIVPCA
jgi:hypothetical protein